MSSRFVAVIIASSTLFLVACTDAKNAVTQTVGDVLQAGSGTISDVKDAAKDIQKRAQSVKKGIEAVQSGANLIKNGFQQ